MSRWVFDNRGHMTGASVTKKCGYASDINTVLVDTTGTPYRVDVLCHFIPIAAITESFYMNISL